jgi:hypothetical protein
VAIRGSWVVPAVRAAIGVALLLAATSVLVAILERGVGVPDASSRAPRIS